jgi:adenylyltransferase/sulfurtransferase
MFGLTDQPIDSAAWRARLADDAAGALVVFEGWVRNHHLGRPVTELEYEAFDALTRLEGEAIVAEAAQAHPGCRVACVHRTGRLRVGELTVWIGAAAPHRAAAFQACRQVIEEIKRRLPVWKKEHHPDGAAEWVNCTTEATASRLAPETYYARQTALPEVGPSGQAALGAANVLVVGIGGLGCPAALYLATAGIGRLTLVDGGLVEIPNLHRQILFTADEVGVAKPVAAAARLKAHNPLARVEALAARVTAANVRALVTGRTAVLDCTDNFAARFLLHDACRAAGVPLVSAAVHRFEGELTVYAPGTPGCLHCAWPDRRPEELDAAGNCAAGPVFAPAVGVLGVMQAAETLKLILRPPGVDFQPTRLVNLLDTSVLAVERTANPACPVCGRPGQSPVTPAADAPDLFLNDEQLAAAGAMRTAWLLEAGEIPARDRPGIEWVAAGDVLRLRELAATGPLVLACRSGVRSAALARLLRTEGLAAVYAQAARSR